MTLLLSAACEDRENQTVRPNGKAVQQEDGREVNSFPIGSDGDDDTVSFLRTETDTTADQPTLCLVFSKPLDPSISYEPYLSLKEKVASRASGQRLCIEGLNYGSTSVLTLRSGLPAADGSELLRDEQVTLTFTDRPPVVQFAGNGVILPRTDGHGIPIMTVNVPSVNVKITR
ncbi:MAG: alpha-2-macroglobulin family protein, partial [Pseudomonadota bacterium]